MKIKELKKLLTKFEKNIEFEKDLKKKIGLILVEKQKFSIKLTH